jgi:hypothetical protein
LATSLASSCPGPAACSALSSFAVALAAAPASVDCTLPMALLRTSSFEYTPLSRSQASSTAEVALSDAGDDALPGSLGSLRRSDRLKLKALSGGSLGSAGSAMGAAGRPAADTAPLAWRLMRASRVPFSFSATSSATALACFWRSSSGRRALVALSRP